MPTPQALVSQPPTWAPVMDWDPAMSDMELLNSTITMETQYQSMHRHIFAPSFSNCQNVTINFVPPKE
jgi:hypothetical protein